MGEREEEDMVTSGEAVALCHPPTTAIPLPSTRVHCSEVKEKDTTLQRCSATCVYVFVCV